MNFLIDTHVLLWWSSQPRRLAQPAQDVIADADNRVFVSVATAWEVAIKMGLGKIRLAMPLETELAQRGFDRLGISFAHAERAGSLPHHHRDPFDRMLVAQAQVEGLTIITRDPQLEPYGAPILWA